ncbi:NAD-dependent succinate-semialdehyde dehydrogenase [Thalassotalea insulae]|uniref:NAD-dependent succinate-semialdehyde dehydrogenase n=1 Tax=Thalassotalea insulae TaxID=2056778 RepID=A0ABQ6GLJ4_9GAMM|nr:NAD-dependent succinate-semialdehyde dehydrogenase [Thalassotalea insulae]GLX76873.1 NAD-dependent succinate-semialdehyde dehydrogenase [Thalassotalea insulae]
MDKITDKGLVKNCSYIDGQWHTSDKRFSVTNPATGETIAQVANASVNDAEQAVIAAHKTFASWSGQTANHRAKLLRNWLNLIIEHQDDLARLLTLEQGKPLAEARGEIGYGAGFIEWFAEEAKRVYGETIPAASQDKRLLVLKQPVGVVSAITPWNFPNAMITRKAAAALAAGCTFIVKPAEMTPLSALALAELAERAGIPAGVFNVVVSDDAVNIGKVLTQHPQIAKFTFTGSTQVGKKLAAQCALGVKKVSLELGGNAPFIVFDDADIDAAVKGAIASKYRNAGQTCICTNRIFVQRNVVEKFTKQYSMAVAELAVGNGLDVDTQIGPLISSQAAEKVKQLVDSSVAQGANIALGGDFSNAGACFYQPTILTEVSNTMPVAQNEIFGPVSAIIPFDSEAEVIEAANDTEYGLAAYFYARDIGRIWRVSEGLAFGMVGVNDSAISNVAAPFGGVKQSGYGREGSRHGLDDYLVIKYLSMGI